MHITGQIPVIQRNTYVCLPLCASAHLSTIILRNLINPLQHKNYFSCPKVTRVSHGLHLNTACSVNEIQVTFHQFCKKLILMCSCGVFSWLKVST